MICDLHTHSTFSDGSLTPEELVDRAARHGLFAIALTDHDTTTGIAAAQRAAEAHDLEVLPGIEISVSERDGERQLHILGLGIDPECEVVASFGERRRAAREERLHEILALLEKAGAPLDLDALDWNSDGGSVGRPHVAAALVAQGHAPGIDAAFSRYLRRGSPAFVPSPECSAKTAIDLIHDAGGIASLAHPPLSSGIGADGGLEKFIGRLIVLGLDAIEVHHPGHRASQRKRLARLCRTYDLVPTGGSDFHGANRPDVKLGRGRAGEIDLGPDFYARIKDRISARIG